MRAWSFPLGRFFGFDLRIHWMFLFLLFLGAALGSTATPGGARVVALWVLLLFAVLVREVARAIAAAACGTPVQSVLLLPMGGLQSYANPAHQTHSPRTSILLALSGPLANLLVGGLIAALLKGASPAVILFGSPLVSASNLLQAAVWLNILMAALHCVPAFPLDAGRLLRDYFARKHGAAEANRAAIGLGRTLGSASTALGIGLLLFPNVPLAMSWAPWLLLGGFFVATGAQLDDQSNVFHSVVDTVAMRDIMLTRFTVLSPSDTVEYALAQSVHSLQDDFPVVRHREIVGVVSRASLLAALRMEGNGYVQSVMARNLLVAAPEETLGAIMRRMREGRVGMIPVATGEGDVVGVVTLQNLRHTIMPLLESRRFREDEKGDRP